MRQPSKRCVSKERVFTFHCVSKEHCFTFHRVTVFAVQVTWEGKTVPIRNEKLRTCIVHARDLEFQLDNVCSLSLLPHIS